ncbi:hypothetical protein DID88_009543 [Monilinia fructigena]|uniref:Integrase catalytic domain-containing protein n=1 Tax=Monilinia fructigena TaxID=38457 RepID=A0A395INS1_9HELO|nr:hypothetical protein DID88_009543 [Monilinia fructigena]
MSDNDNTATPSNPELFRDFIKNNFKYKEEDDDDGDMYGGGGDPDDDGDDDDNNSHRGRRPSWDKRPSKHSNTQSLVSLSKFYTNEEKYGGDDDKFRLQTLDILRNHTTCGAVPMDMQYKAFPIMLKDSALEFFHANYESLPPTFKELCTYMRNNFEGDEYQRNMLSKWNSITLKSTKKENKNKPLSECLTIMIKQLRMLQHRLDPAMRQTSHLHNKLILACEDVEACNLACFDPKKRDKQRREYREKIKGGSNNAFNKRYDQWMIEYEGEATDAESDSETEMGLFFADLDIEDDADEAFFVSSEPISGQEVFNQLSINTILHTMTRDPVEATLPTESAVDIFYTSYTSKEFYGIFTYDPQTAGAANVRFGKGTATSIGSFRVIAPFGDVDFHIVDADIPFLLSLEDMDRLKAFYNNITDQFITPNGQYSVIRRRGHAYNVYIDDSATHQHNAFIKVLQRAGYDENNDAIKHLTKYCKHCQMHSKSPGRFRFTLPEDTEFNHAIYVDVMYIAGEPVLHIFDEATRYQAARFLDNISAKHTFDTLRECWIDVYIGPPDYIIHDAGKNFELEDDNLTKVMVLQMAVKAVNDTAGPNGLVPTLLVYGTYPRLSDINPPTATIIQRAKATKKAMAEVRHIRAKRQVTEALRLRNGPSTTSVLTLPLNSEVLLSSGPTKFRSTSVRPFYTEPEEIEENDGSTNDDDGDTIVVDTSRMEAPRPQTPPPAVQPDVQLRRRMRSNLTNMVNIIDIDTNPPQLTVFLQENTPMRYTESRRKEFDGLMENGVF